MFIAIILLIVVVVIFTIAVGFIILHKNENESKITDDVNTILESENNEEII